MVDMDALKQAVAELQGIINSADGRDMVARRTPVEVFPDEMEEEAMEPEAEVDVVLEEPEEEERKPLTPKQRRELTGF